MKNEPIKIDIEITSVDPDISLMMARHLNAAFWQMVKEWKQQTGRCKEEACSEKRQDGSSRCLEHAEA